MTRALIDANIPIYAAGRPHPLKEPCRQVLLLISDNPSAFLTDSEVLQEILHRYIAIRAWSHGQEVFRDYALLMQGRIEPVYASDVERAASLARDDWSLSARDLVHAAVMQRLGVTRIVSTDTGFDMLPGIDRLDPASVSDWAADL